MKKIHKEKASADYKLKYKKIEKAKKQALIEDVIKKNQTVIDVYKYFSIIIILYFNFIIFTKSLLKSIA